jgi:hypothetical protein
MPFSFWIESEHPFKICRHTWRTDTANQRAGGGGGEWESIKILLEGDGDSKKTNTASNTRHRLTTQVGQAHATTRVLLDLGTNKQPSEPKLTNTHSGNLHGLQPELHRSYRWPAPVRPVTPVRPVDRVGQAGGYSSCTTSVPESLSDFSRPWNKNTPKTQPARKENRTQSLAKQIQTDQEQTSSTTTQRHTSQAVHLRQIPQVAYTGQTGHTHRSDRSKPGQLGMNSTRRSTPPNPTPDLPNRSMDLHKTLGIVGTPHEESIAKFMPTKTCQIKRNRWNLAKNSSNPRTLKTPKSSPLTHKFWRGIKGKRTTKSKVPKTHQENHQERAPKITTKNKRKQHNKALRNHAESSIHIKEVHTRSSLPPWSS